MDVLAGAFNRMHVHYQVERSYGFWILTPTTGKGLGPGEGVN